MHFYRERLFAPPLWWVTGMITMLTFGAIVWTGFDLLITIAVFGTLIAVTAAFLLNWGRAVIEVSAGELRAADATLPLAMTGEVRALSEAQTRALIGPRADPTAHILIRPYLRCAVYIEVKGPDPASPYWLLATRHPAELAAAIESSRPVVSPGGLTMT
ncbi:MAG TPA: DUF3093 domain-containing protein [Streptosporangiaceae bacterium]|nr:DUF3093 domain-containing protein [Streptosporangiaceae bacterium]